VALKRSIRRHLLVFAASVILTTVLSGAKGTLGCVGVLAGAIAASECLFLLVLGIIALFRLIVRRIALRLAFSYFLIGLVPIPLLAALLSTVGYLFASQLVGTRVRREVSAVAETAAISDEGLPEIRVENGRVVESGVEWLHLGDRADWAGRIDLPKPIVQGEIVWFAARPDAKDPGRLALVPLGDPSRDFLQRLADRTGYEVRVGTGRGEKGRSGYHYRIGADARRKWSQVARPRGAPPPGKTFMTREWLVGVSVEHPAATFGSEAANDLLVVLLARTSPRALFDQLFAQGVPEVGRVFWGIVGGLGVALLIVYLVALGIAFFLVASIATSVNRLTRASQAIARGDFSVRVRSKSRDQIGDLARSFDGMADSIQKLLVETAEKQRLDGEIAIARTIQQKLLPPVEADLPGMRLLAHFQPVAEIGGDYYDYLAMPDGRTAVAVGDVSGHGLSTGLLVAMAKAALTTQIESGLTGSNLFTRLNDLIHRSTDSRNYMTLALFAYAAATRRAELTNAGQLAPYRLSGGEVSSLVLPSFPLGTSPRTDFPTASYQLASGDRLVFLTDGLVEAANTEGEPVGFERLEALLKAEAASDAARLKESLLAAVAAHTGGAPPEDDRTLVIVTIA
jgi:serine phosphatase RsbU (regulator of sigma subunit)